MNGKQLKNSILQWAIQGKLVPQDPNDEPASMLLERIRVEKEKLIKEKKIKKDKNESIIYRGEDNSYYEKFLATGEVKCIDEEIPFEIPATWEWCRLGYIFSHCTGKALNGTNRKGNLYTYITTSNLYWDRFELSSLKEMYFTEEELGNVQLLKATYWYARVEILEEVQYGIMTITLGFKIIFINCGLTSHCVHDFSTM